MTAGFGPVEGSNSGALTSQKGTGSGVILDRDGYIITNAHVLEGASKVRVVLTAPSASGRPGDPERVTRSKTVPAKVIGIDSQSDLALVKIDETNLPTLEFADSDKVKQGQLAFAFGSPLGLDNSVTLGVVSSPMRQLDPDEPMVYIQTDAPINPGNSGGPLVDVQGRLIGINTFILSQSGGNEGIGFAAPSNIVKNVYEQIKKDGHVHRGYAGVQLQAVNATLAAGLHLSQDWGVMLSDVVPGGPAEKAGLQIGDIVSKIGGKPIENVREFSAALYQHAIDELVDLEVIRDNRRMVIPVKLIKRTDDPNRFLEFVSQETNLIREWGIFVLPLDDNFADMLPTLRKPAGAVVAARIAGPGAVADFTTGDLICELNGQPVRDIAGLKASIAKLGSGDPVVVQIQRQGELMFVAFEMP
jgi:serine protease Do